MDIARGDLGRWPATKQKSAPGTAVEGDSKSKTSPEISEAPKLKKSPASVAVKAAPITWTLEFAWVISTLGGIPLNIKFQAEISAVVSDVPVMPSVVMVPVTATAVPENFATRRFTS
jgi:hypothetical protein